MRVIFTAPALTDLERIIEYLEQHNPRAAQDVAHRLIDACSALAHFPDRGRRGHRTATRELTIVPPYVISYRPRADVIQILRVWHGAQDR